MKNGVKTALAVGFILLVLGLALFALPLLRGARIQDIWNGAAVNLNENFNLGLISTGYGNLKDYTVCRSGAASFSPDEVRRIDLGWVSGSVKLRTGGGNQIELKETCAQPLKDEQKLCWKLENGTLSVRFCSAAQTRIREKDLVLTVPAGWTAESIAVHASSAEVSLRDLSADGVLSASSISGAVTLNGCSAQTLTVSATSGSVRLDNCLCEELDAGATSGAVGLYGCEARTMKLGTTSGALRAEGCVCDRLEAGTTSGSNFFRCEAKSISLVATSGAIRCEEVPAGCDVTIGANSGTVRLNLKDTRDGQRIKINTTSGSVYLDVPGAIDLDYDTASGDMRGRLEQGGSGCPQVEVDTTSGDLILGAFD